MSSWEETNTTARSTVVPPEQEDVSLEADGECRASLAFLRILEALNPKPADVPYVCKGW